MVGKGGLEPPLTNVNQILSLARLPIPPFAHHSNVLICLSKFYRFRHRGIKYIASFHTAYDITGVIRTGILYTKREEDAIYAA